jgi:hypothetical protein
MADGCLARRAPHLQRPAHPAPHWPVECISPEDPTARGHERGPLGCDRLASNETGIWCGLIGHSGHDGGALASAPARPRCNLCRRPSTFRAEHGLAGVPAGPPKSARPTSRLRWFQFSLRDLLTLIALAAVVCAITVPMIRNWQRSRALEEKAREELRALVKPVQNSGQLNTASRFGRRREPPESLAPAGRGRGSMSMPTSDRESSIAIEVKRRLSTRQHGPSSTRSKDRLSHGDERVYSRTFRSRCQCFHASVQRGLALVRS